MHENHENLIEKLEKGSQRALARLLTIVEDREPGWIDIMKAVQPRTGKVPIVGVTGPAGVGKSTLTSTLAGEMVQQGRLPGIIAVDPSSPFSGGSLLGDRCRMRSVETLPEIFIRSMGSRDGLGGLSPGIMNAARLMEFGGHDVILIETIGTGQDEVEIVHAANLVLLVLAPGMGDIVQAFKAGLMEIADIFVVNKADKPGANQLIGEIHTMSSSLHNFTDEVPNIVETVAASGKGIPELTYLLQASLQEQHGIHEKKRNRVRWELFNYLEMRIRQMIFDNCLDKSSLDQQITRIIDGDTDMFSVVETVLANYR